MGRLLLEEARDGVVTLRFHNPPANALGNQLIAELKEALLALETAADLRAVVITGSGDRFFSAGGDINELEGLVVDGARKRIVDFHEVLDALERFPAPVVCAVNGYAIGGAFELCLFADRTISVAEARFGFPEINHGILPVAKGVERAVRLVGIREAQRMLYEGDLFDARHAHEVGIVEEIVPRERLDERAHEIATMLGSKQRVLFTALKRTINTGGRLSSEGLLSLALTDLDDYFQSDAMKSGMEVFHGRG
jgi:enoyl-CoA hydratase